MEEGRLAIAGKSLIDGLAFAGSTSGMISNDAFLGVEDLLERGDNIEGRLVVDPLGVVGWAPVAIQAKVVADTAM